MGPERRATCISAISRSKNFCIENDKVLYDFYDIECYDPDGNYYGDKLVDDACNYDSDGDGSRDRNWATDWQNAHTEGVDWYSCSAAHSQPLNANQKAYAAWWLFARLAGWDPNSSLSADFTGTPTAGKAPLQVSFEDESIGDIDSWLWDFGDGSVSTEHHPIHIYGDLGTYSVTLEITGPEGGDSRTRSNYITVSDTPVTYNLSVNIAGEGVVEITPENDSYTPGAEVQLNPVPKSGWMFHGWSGDLSGISNPASIIMDQNRTITATFKVDGNPDTISTGTSDGTENDDGGGKGGCFIDITLAVGLFCHDGSKEKN
jgi:uncharacterized repeat protein (TIGR02543 family)